MMPRVDMAPLAPQVAKAKEKGDVQYHLFRSDGLEKTIVTKGSCLERAGLLTMKSNPQPCLEGGLAPAVGVQVTALRRPSRATR
jgi:hypothetical protein